MDQLGKVANHPARGQLNRENEHSLVLVRATAQVLNIIQRVSETRYSPESRRRAVEGHTKKYLGLNKAEIL